MDLEDPLSAEGNGDILQYSYLENSMGRGAWCSTACGHDRPINTITVN